MRRQTKPLPQTNGQAWLDMKNTYGSAVVENFFLVVPTGMSIVRPSAEPTSKKTIGMFDVYLWQDQVPPNRKHQVTMGLAFGQAPTAAATPQIVSTTPAALADDVDPSLTKVTVTFDRPMTDKSWSFTGGGETFPQRAGEISYDAARKTCTMPVKLQPGKVYWVGINSPSYRSFKSADGIPARQYVILFATRSADGKPTALPTDMLKKAKAINEAAQREALQGKLKTWVEDFFSKNYRDITARKTIEWGQLETTPAGNLAIRYKYVATIWGKQKQLIDQKFTFTPGGKYVSAETIEKGPRRRR